VLNLPLLGYTPRFNGSPADFTTFNARTQQFNAALSAMLNGLETNNPAIEVFRFDVATLFSDAIANPQWFGLSNATDSAAPGLQPGMSSYDENQIVANPHEYVFWDDLHPTAIVHAILAERVQMQLAMPGDFNRDNAIDAADYVAWRKRLGSVTTPLDLDGWVAGFGQTSGIGGAASGGNFVPEPPLWASIASVAAFAFFARRRYNSCIG
jgi:phospholipase/lecithinase/hemolysin